MRAIEKVIIHCSDTPRGREDDAADIDRWHKARGWSEIGYHYVVKIDGTVELGRSLEKVGAHTKGQNSNSVGICYIGGQGEDTRTPEQIQSIFLLCLFFDKAYGATIHGHNEFSTKACPQFNVQEIRDLL